MSQTSANVTMAKSRLESAIDRLEKAIAANAAATSDQDLGDATEKLTQELDAAQAEVSGMKVTNEKVSLRLDGAINQMKLMLEEG